MLIDEFIDHFNEHRINTFIPSSTICVDESMSCWYGQGGEWINMGLPMYVSMERKPDSGCEIQNSACGESGVMIHLKIVKTAEEEDQCARLDSNGLLHGTSVCKYLVEPWAFSERIVCADSYFAFRRSSIRASAHWPSLHRCCQNCHSPIPNALPIQS